MDAFAQSQFVIISSIDWDSAWQRHQIFAWQLAEAGHDVFFVENSGFRSPEWRDSARIWNKLRSMASGPRPQRRKNWPPRLKLFTPRVLPPTGAACRGINRRLLIPRVAEGLRCLGLRGQPVVITYFPTATSLELIRLLRPAAVVYDCASNFRAHPHAPPDFARQESELLARADIVVCDSDFLYNQKRAEHGNVVQIHQGVPEDFFRVKPAALPPRRFCYYGTWGQDLDPRFLTALDAAGFEITVSGFSKGEPPPLPPSIRRLQPVPREQLVRRLEDFDAFLLPYRINPFLLGVLPAKIYECLAMGRPIIATPLPAFEPLHRLMHISADPEEWVRIAGDLPRTETPAIRAERIALAREHTCAKEFQRFQEAVRAAWASAR